MHYGSNGREPLHGLTFERPTPIGELAKNQKRVLQTWAIGFYNNVGELTVVLRPIKDGLESNLAISL